MAKRHYLLEGERRLRPEAGRIAGVVWSPSGDAFAPLSVDLAVYDLKGNRLVYKKRPSSEYIPLGVALVGDYVLVGKTTPEVWSLSTGEVLKKLKVNIYWSTGISAPSFFLSQDASLVAAVSRLETSAHRFAVWDTGTWETVRKGYMKGRGRIVSVAFSPDNSVMAMGDVFGNVRFVETRGRSRMYGRTPLPGVYAVVSWNNWENEPYGNVHVAWKGEELLALSWAKWGTLTVPVLYFLDGQRQRVRDVLNLYDLFKAYAVQEVLTGTYGLPELSLQTFKGGWAVSVGSATLLLDDSLNPRGVMWEGPVSISPDGRHYVIYGEHTRGVQVYELKTRRAVLPYVPIGEVKGTAYLPEQITFSTYRGEVASVGYDGENLKGHRVPGRTIGVAPWREGTALVLTSVAPDPDEILISGDTGRVMALIHDGERVADGYDLHDLPLLYPKGAYAPSLLRDGQFEKVRVSLLSVPDGEIFAVLFNDNAYIYIYGRGEATLKYDSVSAFGFYRDGFVVRRNGEVIEVRFNGEEERFPVGGDFFPVHAPDSPLPVLVSKDSVFLNGREIPHGGSMGIVFLLKRLIFGGPPFLPAHYDRKRNTLLIPHANYVLVVPLDGSPPESIKLEERETSSEYAVGSVFCRKNTLYGLELGEIRRWRKRGLKCT